MKQIAHLEPGIPLRAFPVDLDPLEADVFLGQRRGEEGHCLAQPAVQPLPGVIFPNGKFLHIQILLRPPETLGFQASAA